MAWDAACHAWLESIIKIKVTAVEYFEDPTHSQSVFKQVSLQLGVWVK